MNKQYYTEIHDSVKNIDTQEWAGLIDSGDLAMDPRLIHLMENTLSDQARFWTVVIRDSQQQVIACACLSVFQTDILQSSPGFLQTAVRRLRVYWPAALKLKVLFCGLPLPSAHSQLRVRQCADWPVVLQLLNGVMANIARQEKAQLLVFKELDAEQDQQVRHLEALGFVRGELEPLYQLSRSFKDFNEYSMALRSSYRHQIQANVKRFKAAGLQVEHIMAPEEITAQFSDAVHQLYLNVWERAKEKLECFSANFFRELPKALPGQVAFTLIKDDQKPVAFAIGVLGDDAYHNLYVGLDYTYAARTDLYFNLFYQELDAVFRFNKKKIFLGQTSGMFKARLGATIDPRFFWVRPVNFALRLIFKHFRAFIFPKMKYIQHSQVFKE